MTLIVTYVESLIHLECCYTMGMRIYVSGIGGVAMGPLAMIARDMGHEVVGSNDTDTDLVRHMQTEDFTVKVGQEDGFIEQVHEEQTIDWFVYTAALPAKHPELTFAREHGIRSSKRDEFINELLHEHGLSMLAISGTNGKTNTTGMVIWCLQQAGIPISYSVGSRISFGPFGTYQEGSQYFVYEADEFDRNMLKFEPAVSLITSIDYDHPDTYPSREEYRAAFAQFVDNSGSTYLYSSDAEAIGASEYAGIHAIDKSNTEDSTDLPGIYIRQNARLVIEMLTHQFGLTFSDAVQYLNQFPGTERRMEQIAKHVYSDYGHHPAAIRSAIAQANELGGEIIVVYQPHQNIRQHEVKDEYKECFLGVKHIYWLPTYLSREGDSDLPIIPPAELIAILDNANDAEPAKMDTQLAQTLKTHASSGRLVLCLSAGDLDEWVRQQFG